MTGTLLDPQLLARLEALQLGTRRRLAGGMTGEHRSVRRGASLDFADYRQYHPGDDFRRIDYHLYARLDVLLVKLFDAEDDLQVRLLVDTSASMAGAKLEQAKRLAAALGFVALIRRDPVSVHTFPFEPRAPRFLGRSAIPVLFGRLADLEAAGPTPFAAAAGHLLARSGPPGLTVVVSDLLTPEWEATISRLPARGGDLVVIHVLDRDEMEPDIVGDVDLVDRETGAHVSVSGASDARATYARALHEWLDRVAARTRHVGAAYVRVLADDDVGSLLLGSWRRAGVLR